MRTPHWKPITLTHPGPFTIVVSFEEEITDPRHHFLNECGWSEEAYKPIANAYWFGIKVAAVLHGFEYGTAYLGGCCYKNLSEFVGDDKESMAGGYMPQLIEEAIAEAEVRMGNDATTWPKVEPPKPAPIPLDQLEVELKNLLMRVDAFSAMEFDRIVIEPLEITHLTDSRSVHSWDGPARFNIRRGVSVKLAAELFLSEKEEV